MIIEVKVKSNAKVNKIEVVIENKSYIVSTKQMAIDGKANLSIISLLSEYFNVSKKSIVIKRGISSSNKVIEILE